MWASVSDISDSQVKAYFVSLEPTLQQRLFELLRLFHSAIPQAEVTIKYGMPTLVLKKSILHIAAWKNHCGVYPGANAIRVFAPVLTEFMCSKGAIQIPHTIPFPKKILLDLLAYRVKAVEDSMLKNASNSKIKSIN